MIFETVTAILDDEGELRGYRVNDAHCVPLDAGNRDYAELMKKIADGTVVVA